MFSDDASTTVAAAGSKSAQKLCPVKAAIEKRIGKTVELEVVMDPSLIGGVRTRVGSIVFDGTIRSSLARLAATLIAKD